MGIGFRPQPGLSELEPREVSNETIKPARSAVDRSTLASRKQESSWNDAMDFKVGEVTAVNTTHSS
jgi:hypothetical protein